MTDTKQALKEYVQKLKTERDELRLKLKLSNMEFRDHWDAAEIKWNRLEQKMEDLSHESMESSRAVAHELAEMYRNMRDVIKR
jgi:predicted  nucleic acid-binding Zn-ribbon protein